MQNTTIKRVFEHFFVETKRGNAVTYRMWVSRRKMNQYHTHKKISSLAAMSHARKARSYKTQIRAMNETILRMR